LPKEEEEEDTNLAEKLKRVHLGRAIERDEEDDIMGGVRVEFTGVSEEIK